MEQRHERRVYHPSKHPLHRNAEAELMKPRSLLLALSGSQHSRYAAEVSWRLSRQLGTRVTAQHVVDSHSAWEFIGHEHPAFLESGRYLSEYQNLCKTLFCLGEELSASYEAQAKLQNVEGISVVDEGNPISEICRRSLDHNMVVIGHRPNTISKDNPRSQVMRLSIAESLAHDCPRPLLVVQGSTPGWKNLAVMISIDHINEIFINSCLDTATLLGLQPALVCLAGGPNEEKPQQFIKDIRKANPGLAKVPIAVSPLNEELFLSAVESWDSADTDISPEDWDKTLIVIPTREIGGQRLTVVNSSPSLFVRYLTLPSILMWPEEYHFTLSAGASHQVSIPV